MLLSLCQDVDMLFTRLSSDFEQLFGFPEREESGLQEVGSSGLAAGCTRLFGDKTFS